LKKNGISMGLTASSEYAIFIFNLLVSALLRGRCGGLGPARVLHCRRCERHGMAARLVGKARPATTVKERKRVKAKHSASGRAT
jgi:hypothetical protein